MIGLYTDTIGGKTFFVSVFDGFSNFDGSDNTDDLIVYDCFRYRLINGGMIYTILKLT